MLLNLSNRSSVERTRVRPIDFILNIKRQKPELIDPLDLSIDIVTAVLAFGAGFFAFRIRSTFKGGLLWRAWRIIGPSAVIYGFGKVAGILADTLDSPFLLFVQTILELFFVLALASGLYFFHKAWNPKEAPKK